MEEVMNTMRAMAWQRAKGELLSYLETYWPKYDRRGQKLDNGFEDAQKRIDAFIADFENNR
jgi:hypothetical protein